MDKILFVTAHSHDQKPIKLNDEYHSVVEARDNTKFGKYFQIIDLPNPDKKRLRDRLKKESPLFFHFAGHGYAEGEPILFDGFRIEPESFANLLKEIKGLKCVFLNSCNSASFIKHTREVVEYSIGIKGSIPPESAVEFSTMFYQYIYDGDPIFIAFDKTFNSLSYLKESGYAPVLELKSRYIMEKILLDNQHHLGLDEDLKQQILRFSEKLNSGGTDDVALLQRLIKNHQQPLIVDWFLERRSIFIKALSDKVLGNKSASIKEDFAWDLDSYFELFEILLVNMDGKHLLKKEDVASIKYSSEIDRHYYLDALDELIEFAKDVSGHSPDALYFFSDRVNHFKSLF
jgi:hypothetical protein